MSLQMSDISKVLGLPRETKKPSTLKKVREPPAPKYIDKQRAIAIARQLKIGKIGKVTLRVSDRTRSLDSEIPKTSEKASRTLTRRFIIDHTKGMQTATITKDSAVGKCIMGPNAYHNRRLATKMDKIIEDEEKRRSMLIRKTREFKQHQKKALPDPRDPKKHLDTFRHTPPGGRLPGLSQEDSGTSGRRSKSPGYMRPLSCNRTRSSESQVAEAEAFLNSNVIRATLEAPTNTDTVRALDLVEASNTEYVRPKSGSKYDNDNNEQSDTGSGTKRKSEEDTPHKSHKNNSIKPESNYKPLSPFGNAFASGARTLIQRKAEHNLSETIPSDSNDLLVSDGKQQNMNMDDDELQDLQSNSEPVQQSELASEYETFLTENNISADDILLMQRQQTYANSSGKGSTGLPNKFAHALRKSKKKPNFMETILDESPVSSAGKRTPNLETSLSRKVIERMSALSPGFQHHDTNNAEFESSYKSPIENGKASPPTLLRRTSSMSMKRAATLTAQVLSMQKTTRKSRRKKNVAFSKTTKETLEARNPNNTVIADPRFVNLTSALIPDSAGARHLYDEISVGTISDLPPALRDKQSGGQKVQNAMAYSRKSENLAKFEELFGKCQV